MNDKMMTFAMMLGIALPVCAAVYAVKNIPPHRYYWGYYPYYNNNFFRYPRW